MADDFDDIDLQEDDDDDRYVRLNKNDVERLRKAAKRSAALEKEVGGFKRRDAISKAGLTDLTDAQREALTKLVEDPTPEALRGQAEALGWVTPSQAEEPEPDDTELDAHAKAAAAGNGASAPASRRVKPEDTEDWTHEKRMRFDAQHPDLYGELLKGNEIELPAGFN